MLVRHLGIQLAARRFRHKAIKSTANVHQTHNQRADERVNPTDPPEKEIDLNNSPGRRQVEHPANVNRAERSPVRWRGRFRRLY
jgi:hypothetical protein